MSYVDRYINKTSNTGSFVDYYKEKPVIEKDSGGGDDDKVNIEALAPQRMSTNVNLNLTERFNTADEETEMKTVINGVPNIAPINFEDIKYQSFNEYMKTTPYTLDKTGMFSSVKLKESKNLETGRKAMQAAGLVTGSPGALLFGTMLMGFDQTTFKSPTGQDRYISTHGIGNIAGTRNLEEEYKDLYEIAKNKQESIFEKINEIDEFELPDGNLITREGLEKQYINVLGADDEPALFSGRYNKELYQMGLDPLTKKPTMDKKKAGFDTFGKPTYPHDYLDFDYGYGLTNLGDSENLNAYIGSMRVTGDTGFAIQAGNTTIYRKKGETFYKGLGGIATQKVARTVEALLSGQDPRNFRIDGGDGKLGSLSATNKKGDLIGGYTLDGGFITMDGQVIGMGSMKGFEAMAQNHFQFGNGMVAKNASGTGYQDIARQWMESARRTNFKDKAAQLAHFNNYQTMARNAGRGNRIVNSFMNNPLFTTYYPTPQYPRGGNLGTKNIVPNYNVYMRSPDYSVRIKDRGITGGGFDFKSGVQDQGPGGTYYFSETEGTDVYSEGISDINPDLSRVAEDDPARGSYESWLQSLENDESQSSVTSEGTGFGTDEYTAYGGQIGQNMLAGGSVAPQLQEGTRVEPSVQGESDNIITANELIEADSGVTEDSGFIEKKASETTDQEGIADDKPVKLSNEANKRGAAIVLNKPSVDIHGEKKVEKMMRDGLRYLRSKGRQISDDDEKYIKDNYSDVLISKGEIVIQPELADVLGRKRLLAMNERGKRRVAAAQRKQKTASGGFIKKKFGDSVTSQGFVVEPINPKVLKLFKQLDKKPSFQRKNVEGLINNFSDKEALAMLIFAESVLSKDSMEELEAIGETVLNRMNDRTYSFKNTNTIKDVLKQRSSRGKGSKMFMYDGLEPKKLKPRLKEMMNSTYWDKAMSAAENVLTKGGGEPDYQRHLREDVFTYGKKGEAADKLAYNLRNEHYADIGDHVFFSRVPEKGGRLSLETMGESDSYYRGIRPKN